jgi:hypothetical protein
MKTRNLVLGMVILMMTLGACREINVRTTVNRDGSFTRTITVSGDSAEAFKKELPYPVDATWTMTSKKDTAGKGKFIVTYTKNFKDCEALNTAIGSDTSWLGHLVRHTDIRKKFGFFYSYIEYRETYPAANPFTALPYKAFVTPEDYLWITREHPVVSPSDSIKSKAAEDKVMNYLVESATAGVEKVLAMGLRKLNDRALDKIKVAEFHDRIRVLISKGNFRDEGVIIDSLRIWTGNSEVNRLKEIQPPLFGDFNRKAELLENLLTMENFHAEIVMPGLITATNSTMLTGNQVSWDVFPMVFLLEDYSMVVESRVINVWAFVLTGIVLLAFLGLVIVKSRLWNFA